VRISIGALPTERAHVEALWARMRSAGEGRGAARAPGAEAR